MPTKSRRKVPKQQKPKVDEQTLTTSPNEESVDLDEEGVVKLLGGNVHVSKRDTGSYASTDSNGLKPIRHAITCSCCGKPKYEEYFYTNRTSPAFKGTFNKVPICSACLDSLYMSCMQACGDELASAANICSIMDLPYNQAVVYTHIKDGKFIIGNYARTMNLPMLKGKTFLNSILDGEFFDAKDKVKAAVEKIWTRQDKRNKDFVISKLGYDPFESFGFEDSDYRSAFNISAKYLEDDSICQDAHKMQSLITMVATIIQCNKIEALLTFQYKNINPDTNKIKTLTGTKKDLQLTISKLAEDNNMSSKYQKENKSAQSHLSAKMKEMQNAEYWESKPNMFDVRTGAAMRQVFDLSHQSIIAQLELQDSDYANMVKEQREMIKTLQEKCDRLEEENRNLANQIIHSDAEGGK